MLNLISERYDKFKMVCRLIAEIDSTELSVRVHVHSRYMNANYSYLCNKCTLRKTSERLRTKLNIEYSCIVAALRGIKNLGIRDITSFS